MRAVVALVAAACLALPAKAPAVFGDQEIPEFRVVPSTTQAGGHPNVDLFFRFCNRGPDIVDVTNTSPIVVTTATPHGISPNAFSSVRILGVEGTTAANGDWFFGSSNVISTTQFSLPSSTGNGAYVASDNDQVQVAPTRGCLSTTERSQLSPKLKDFKLHLPPGFLGNPMAADVCPIETWEASQGSCPSTTILGSSVSETIVQSSGPGAPLLPVFTPLFNIETIGHEPARLGTDRFGSTPPGPLPDHRVGPYRGRLRHRLLADQHSPQPRRAAGHDHGDQDPPVLARAVRPEHGRTWRGRKAVLRQPDAV